MQMRRFSRKAGLSPGSLVYVGEEKTAPVKLSVIHYDSQQVEEAVLTDIRQIERFRGNQAVTWLNVSGIHDLALIAALGERFGLHALVLEDVVNTEQRPKMEDYEDFLFVVLKMLSIAVDKRGIAREQVSLIMRPGLVISLQEHEGDIFDPVRERIRKAKGRIRSQGAEYLLYALIDAVVDNYFNIFEEIGEQIESLRETVVSDPRSSTLHAVHQLKDEMILLRKSVWPLREIVGGIVRGDSELIDKSMVIYFRDIYDHTVQVIETLETFRDMLTGMLDIYLSSVSNRMNEVMKLLTIIATIFIPLTFLTGLYGMNFKHMPELDWRWSYPLFWVVIILISAAMIAYFKHKDWL